MRWLADENLARAIVQWLRDTGHDVQYAAEVMASRLDDDLLLSAQRDGRFIITDDKDFGELVFHRHLNSHGILLLRIRAPSIAQRLSRLTTVWREIEDNVAGNMVVVTESKVRVRKIALA